MNALYRVTVWLQLDGAPHAPDAETIGDDLAELLQKQLRDAHVIVGDRALSIGFQVATKDAPTAQVSAENQVLAVLRAAGIDGHRAKIDEVDVQIAQ